MAGHGLDLRLQVRYQLSDDEFASLTTQLLERFQTAVGRAVDNGHKAVCIALDGADPLSDLCRHIEWSAFETLADNLPPQTMSAEYGPYDERSVFLLGLDLKSMTPLAALRVILGLAGVGPATKSVRDAVVHDGYRSDPEILDLTDPRDSIEDQHLRTCGEVGASGLPSVLHDRRSVEDAHSMVPGELIFDIGTLARLPSVASKEAGILWTPLMLAGGVRLAAHLDAKHVVSFVTSDLIRVSKKICGAPWTHLANFGEVVYVPGDEFLSQPSYMGGQEFSQNLQTRRDSVARRPIPERNLDWYAHDSDADSVFVL